MPNKYHIPNLHHETETTQLLKQYSESDNPVTKSSLKQCLSEREVKVEPKEDYYAKEYK